MTTKPMNILEAIWHGREALGDQPMQSFVNIGSSGALEETSRSYASLWRHGSAVCQGLRAESMAPGDSLALVMHNHAEFVDCMVGSAMAGAVYVPIDPRAVGARLRYLLDFAGCRGAVVAGYALHHVLDILDQLPRLEWIWVLEGTLPAELSGPIAVRRFEDVLIGGAEEEPLRAIDPAEPMQMIYTSGTTGDPKAILSPHARFMFATSVGSAIGLTEADKPYTGLPLSHSNAQLMTLGNALTMRLPVVISRRFTKSRLWEILSRYECTTFNLLGGMTTAIFAEPAGPFDRAHKVRFVLSAGMPTAMWNDFQERFGVTIFEFYGTAEGGLLLNPPGGPIGSIGKPPPGMICAVLDSAGEEVADGELGELCFRDGTGAVPPVRYFKNEAASAEKTRGGWFHSGDMGWRNSDGWFYFAHRMGSAIRRNGEFISPSDVERIIAEDANVADVYVYGAAGVRNSPGEREVIAAIVPTDERVDIAAIFARCRSALPLNSVPAFIQIVAEIPKTASEKPQDRFLIDMLRNGTSRLCSADGTHQFELGE